MKKSFREDQIVHKIANNCRGNISKAAAFAVLLDLRPLCLAESKDGMTSFAQTLFEAGQLIPYGVKIDHMSYLPSRTGVSAALKSLMS